METQIREVNLLDGGMWSDTLLIHCSGAVSWQCGRQLRYFHRIDCHNEPYNLYYGSGGLRLLGFDCRNLRFKNHRMTNGDMTAFFFGTFSASCLDCRSYARNR